MEVEVEVEEKSRRGGGRRRAGVKAVEWERRESRGVTRWLPVSRYRTVVPLGESRGPRAVTALLRDRRIENLKERKREREVEKKEWREENIEISEEIYQRERRVSTDGTVLLPVRRTPRGRRYQRLH